MITDLATHPEPYVRVSALARYWNCDPSTLYRDIDKGALLVERHGSSGRIRVPIGEARRYGKISLSQAPQVPHMTK